MKITPVEEVTYGVYVWQMPDGSIVQDEDGNYLNIAAVKGDLRRINKIKLAAKELGLEEGHPLWFSGHRPISDDEYEMQKQRLNLGLVPDEMDLPAITEDLNQKKKMGLL
jgi:hypothetical protein